ncbi:MAG: methyltransferase domain-containing protein [Planctomycetota bacterium]|nr:methyltransferase domain-containing protein [Planctomycetota bacterium]
MSIIIEHEDARIRIDELPNGKRRVSVSALKPSTYVPADSCETSYSLKFIKYLIAQSGGVWICFDIMRDEDPWQLQNALENTITGYISKDVFTDKRVLDFGCGQGASTAVLARILPQCRIVGVDLDVPSLNIAKARAEYYGLRDVEFFASPDPAELPDGIGQFDFIIMNAVYEHLLPSERKTLLPRLWTILRPGGILFIDETPHRYFPLEIHTTMLPLINYLPDRFAHEAASRLSRKISRGLPWNELLRGGIRGGTEREIMKILRQNADAPPTLLEPAGRQVRDRIDLWYAVSRHKKCPALKALARLAIKAIKWTTNYTLVPTLSLAIRKNS